MYVQNLKIVLILNKVRPFYNLLLLLGQRDVHFSMFMAVDEHVLQF